MHKVAQAFLTHRYESSDTNEHNLYSPGGFAKTLKPMRTIEIKTKRNKPIMVLQSEDTPLAIEKTLKENGWSIVSWNGDNIQLAAVAVLQNQSAMQQQAAVKAGNAPNGKAGAIGCLILILITVLFVSCSVAISSGNKDKPKTGSETMAQIMCEEFVKQRLNAPSTAKFSRVRTLTNNPNNYIVLGYVEAGNALGGTVGSPYRCELTYDPATDKWSSDTSIK